MRTLLFCCLIVACSISGVGLASGIQPDDPRLDVIAGFLKASYARDYRAAYGYIAERDQRVWGKESYARRNGSLSGFSLALAKALAARMQVWTISSDVRSDRAHYDIGYRAPTADELSSALFDWDQKKLDMLSKTQQQRLLDSVQSLVKSPTAVAIDGRESFEMVRENGAWKIFHNWAAANKVRLNIDSPTKSGITAELASDEFVIKPSTPFEVTFTLRNRSDAPVSVRVIHHLEPRSIENHLEMIACGALTPIALRPGESQEITMAYLLSAGIRRGQKIDLSYEIKADPSHLQTSTNPRSDLRLSRQPRDRRFANR